MKVDDERFIKV